VSQVIERTIQAAVPQDASVGIAMQAMDPSADAVSRASKSIVRLESAREAGVTGLGLVVSKDGAIIADRTAIAGLGDYVAVLPSGTRIRVSVVQMQANGDIVFLAPSTASSTISFSPIAFSGTPKLGQTVLSLSGTSSSMLRQGIVTEVIQPDTHSDGSEHGRISTTISLPLTTPGGPLFALDGSVLGMATYSLSKKDSGSFYPVAQLKAVIPSLK
jgi:S1-C subfamily serine protease